VKEYKDKSETESFNRKTFKFVIHENDLQNVIDNLEKNCILLKHPNSITNTQILTSCYFEDDNHTSYYSRLEKLPCNELMRARIYNNDAKSIYVELKSNNSLNMKTNSTKERLLIKSEDFIRLTNGCGLCPTANSTFIDKVNYLTQTRNTKPQITIQYTRSSYDKNGVKITLDYNIKGQKVSPEQKLECFNVDANRSGIFKLNFSILEVKTDSNINVLETHLIQTLMNKKLIKPLNALSKYSTIYHFFNSHKLTSRPFYYNALVGDSYSGNSKNLFPITLKPNTFTSIEALFYRIFNIVIGIPISLVKYHEITGHKSFLLEPYILKNYLILCLFLNLMTFCKVKHNLINKTINHIGTIFPLLVSLVFIIGIIF
jgi:SPX domain protein involved in polyphosphate accumulation